MLRGAETMRKQNVLEKEWREETASMIVMWYAIHGCKGLMGRQHQDPTHTLGNETIRRLPM